MNFDAVIFDIDNVLIDTRASYTDCIIKTVKTYLETILGFQPSRNPLLSRNDVESFKSLGGFNDDWDCCYGLLVYLLSLPVSKRTIEALKKAANLEKFSKTIKESPLRVSGITALFGRPTTITIEKVARIFQEVYLGKDLFPIITPNFTNYWLAYFLHVLE